MDNPTDRWWRRAAIYQVYPRSFADGDGDGVGDLAGVRARLPYLAALGVDAIWFTPWYPSDGADGGYDVADYRSIDPAFGTLADAEALIGAARELGIRTIVDIVPNHIAASHPWFAQALAAGPGSPERDRFFFRPGRGADGADPPNGWQSSFGGPAWRRVTEPDGRPGEWYLHLFAPEQVDLNWRNADVRAEFEDVLRFWLRRGVAGVRVDSATMIIKDPALPEVPADPGPGQHPYVDQDEVHEVYRQWRAVVDQEAPGEAALVGEVWLGDLDRLVAYLRPDEMHTAFNFDLMTQPWDSGALRASITRTLDAHRRVDAPPTWVLSNHDVTRPVTRFGRADTAFDPAGRRHGVPTDLALGRRRAAAAALLVGALPGSLYVYQGDELGLPEVEDIGPDQRRDPIFAQTGGADPGRDGCRVPLPWTASGTSHGFGPDDGAAPWLPQPPGWGAYAVDAQTGDPGSMLTLYRTMLALRRDLPDLAGSDLRWLGGDGLGGGLGGVGLGGGPGDGVLAFGRGAGFACVVNLGAEPVPLPDGEVLLTSGPLTDRSHLPGDTAAWLRLA